MEASPEGPVTDWPRAWRLWGQNALDALQDRVGELRFFGGLGSAETARILAESSHTVMRD